MDDLLALSSAMIDAGELSQPANRVTNRLSEVADGVAVVESFSHAWLLRTGEGLVVVDCSGPQTAGAVVDAVRGWTSDPVHTIVYTHGHIDHVGGSGAFVADGRDRGHRDPRVLAHTNVDARFDRYDRTNGWNMAVNARQFGGINPAHNMGVGGAARFLPADTARPTDTFATAVRSRVGDVELDLRHHRGETDDHAWVWVPERRAVLCGDFVTWVFPNAGNPQKVQRYPGEWATALREMAALEPELLLPAHGLPVAGRERIARMLDTIATTLERLVDGVIDLMNAGAPLDEIVRTVRVPDDVLALPYLRPVYDEPEFVVRNIWRLYGGWWDGDPSTVKPPAKAALAAEVAALAGGAATLVRRARELSAAGDHRLACSLVELAVGAAPDDREAHAARADLYAARRSAERSLMAKGVFAAAARASAERVAERVADR